MVSSTIIKSVIVLSLNNQEICNFLSNKEGADTNGIKKEMVKIKKKAISENIQLSERKKIRSKHYGNWLILNIEKNLILD